MDVDIFHIWDDLRVGHSGKQACWNHGRIAERNYSPEVLFNLFLCSSHRIFASNPFCWWLVVYFTLKQNGFCFGSMDFGPLDRVLLEKTASEEQVEEEEGPKPPPFPPPKADMAQPVGIAGGKNPTWTTSLLWTVRFRLEVEMVSKMKSFTEIGMS